MKMKYFFFMSMIFIGINSFAQANYNDCSKNTDVLYNRKGTLKNIAKRLNKINHIYKIDHPRGYVVTDDNFYNFFIYDLVDTSNIYPNDSKKCIEFKDGHVYHIASLNSYFKVSVILVLLQGKLYFFEGLNCEKKINKIEEVIKFIEINLHYAKDDVLLKRVLNFKDYDLSYSVDQAGKIPVCQCGN